MVRAHSSSNRETEISVNLEGHYEENQEETPTRSSHHANEELISSLCASDRGGGSGDKHKERDKERDKDKTSSSTSSSSSTGGSLEISFHIKEAWNIFEVQHSIV